MATSRGGADVKRFMAQLPAQIESRILMGAARAGGAVILTEAKARSISHDVDEALTMKAKRGIGQVTVKILVKPGWARSVGIWLEYGTAPHFISVDDSQRRGMSVKRINTVGKEKGSLVIGGKFVGATVFNKGARAHPFMRISLDVKGAEAVAAAQAYINSQVLAGRIIGDSDAGDGE
jgi:hypothetical protein